MLHSEGRYQKQHFRKKVTRRESPKKCLTKPRGSEILRRAIDEYWERFEKKAKSLG
jgi:hypothetical protein